MIGYKPLDTGVVEIAEDRQTAKGIWFIRGSYADLTPGGPLSYWAWGWLAADFVWEDGEWRFWHLLEVYDIHTPCGTKWNETPEPLPDMPEFAAIRQFHMPEPTVQRTVRQQYHTQRRHTPPPQFPKPYRTFEETFSYGTTMEVN
jgi:hypothetical protein